MLWVQFEKHRSMNYNTAKQIIQDVNNFIVNGWKVARQIPKWIHGYDAWINFLDEQCSHNNNEEYKSKKDFNNDKNKDFEYQEEDEGKHDAKVEEIEEVQEDKEVSEEEKEGDGVEEEGSDEDEEEEEEKRSLLSYSRVVT